MSERPRNGNGHSSNGASEPFRNRFTLEQLQDLFPDIQKDPIGVWIGGCPVKHTETTTWPAVKAIFVEHPGFAGDYKIKGCDLHCMPRQIWDAAVRANSRKPTKAKAATKRVHHNGDPVAEPLTVTLQLSDTGNAERFAFEHGRDVRYCKPWRKWLVWDGRRWKPDDIGAVELRAKQTVREISGEAFHIEDKARRHDLLRHALRSEGARHRAAMLRLAECEPGIPVRPASLDADPWLLNVQNGTIDLRTGTRREHRREDLLTKLAGAAFDPQARAPAWEAFLGRIMDADADLIGFLQRAAGYALTGDVSAETLFFLVGKGANGKTTFVCTLQALLGEYARTVKSDLLLASAADRGANRASPDVMALCGTRLAVCPETDEGRALNAAMVKQITSRDRIPARPLYAEATEFVPTHKLVLATNHRPRVRSADDGTWRRIQLVPFEVTIPEKEQDPHLLERLLCELPGILTWAVNGCREWQKLGGGAAGLAPPARVKQATRSYREEEDVIAPFLAEMCVLQPGERIAKGELFRAYEKWAEDNRENSVGSRTFNARVQELDGIRSAKSGSTRRWEGIRLRDARDATDAVLENSPPTRARSDLFENRGSSVPTVPPLAHQQGSEK